MLVYLLHFGSQVYFMNISKGVTGTLSQEEKTLL